MGTSKGRGEYYLDIEDRGESYAPEMVLEHVIWPCVDELWRDNWRAKSCPGEAFSFPKSSYIGDKLLMVTLDVENNTEIGNRVSAHEITLSVGEPIVGEARTLALGMAKAAIREQYFDFDDDFDGDDERAQALEFADPEDPLLLLNKSTVYTFNTACDPDEFFQVESYRTLEGEDWFYGVPPHSSEGDDGFSGDILDHDLRILTDASRVLKVSDVIANGLKYVRERPES